MTDAAAVASPVKLRDQPTIYVALAAVMDGVKHVAKRDFNDHQKFSFRGVDAVVNAVGPVLREHGVIVVPSVQSVDYEKVVTTNNKPSTACRVLVSYVFYGPAGDSITASVIGEAWDSGDKAAPKAMSVAFRTALLQALALPTDEPDPDSHVYERGHEQAPAPDPMLIAKVAVKKAWEYSHGGEWDPEAMSAEFEQWAARPIADAEPGDLTLFAEELARPSGSPGIPPPQTDDGAVEAADSRPDPAPSSPPTRRGYISPKQVTALSIAFADMGLDHDDALDWLEKHVGRRVESRKDLTATEAKRALDDALMVTRGKGAPDEVL